MDPADLRRWHQRRPRQADAPAPPAPAPAYPNGYAVPSPAVYNPGYPAAPPPPPASIPPGYALVQLPTGQYGLVPLMPAAPYPAPGAVVSYAPSVVSVPPMPVVHMPGAPPTTVPAAPARTTQIVRPLNSATDPYDDLLAATPDLPTGYMNGRFHQALNPGENDERGMVKVANHGGGKYKGGDGWNGSTPTATVSRIKGK